MPSENAGRRGSQYRRDRENQRLKFKRCWICGQEIDYSLVWPHPDSFSLDHIKSWKLHPELRTDPANFESAHLRCNQSKGKGDAPVSLGSLSEEF